jgi:hypothetical protein
MKPGTNGSKRATKIMVAATVRCCAIHIFVIFSQLYRLIHKKIHVCGFSRV